VKKRSVCFEEVECFCEREFCGMVDILTETGALFSSRHEYFDREGYVVVSNPYKAEVVELLIYDGIRCSKFMAVVQHVTKLKRTNEANKITLK
jgi:hypothetical protein